ncbi:hypothetical protein PVAP13_4NG009400 [Panicum virgatum]|uniref:Uncharacterized protein n=1 Tax=Panicum virgatum TaxID=38727 RepID=A0A8T0T3E9_PANVG|nr:hypothetical protein PVAP13_4NG009400 [Panicum virgatum]
MHNSTNSSSLIIAHGSSLFDLCTMGIGDTRKQDDADADECLISNLLSETLPLIGTHGGSSHHVLDLSLILSNLLDT